MNKKIKVLETDFLLPHMNVLTGMGAIFNLAGNYYEYNSSESAEEADCKASYSDWSNVGGDIEVAIELYSKKSKESKEFEFEK